MAILDFDYFLSGSRNYLSTCSQVLCNTHFPITGRGRMRNMFSFAIIHTFKSCAVPKFSLDLRISLYPQIVYNNNHNNLYQLHSILLNHNLKWGKLFNFKKRHCNCFCNLDHRQKRLSIFKIATVELVK